MRLTKIEYEIKMINKNIEIIMKNNVNNKDSNNLYDDNKMNLQKLINVANSN